MEVVNNQSLKAFNTFGIDVKASKFCSIQSEKGLEQFQDLAVHENQDLILGGGSNILFTRDFDGIVGRIEIGGIEVVDENRDYVWVRTGAGVVWHKLVEFCLEKDFGGIENLSLIPGTTGAAPMQNIGAYGVELGEVFVELQAFERKSGDMRTFTNDECKFGYRESIFKKALKDQFVITHITLKLSRRDHQINTEYGTIKYLLEDWGIENPSIRDVSNVVISIRRSKLPDPLEIGNAGSFFKNPIIDKIDFEGLKLEFPDIKGYEAGPDHVKVPAGWLIDQCGWKGKRQGNIGVHTQQALVIVNYGDGKGQDLLALSKDIQRSVADTYGITLQPEVNII